MPKSEFSAETRKALLQLLDSSETIRAIGEVLSAECRTEKERASREAMSPEPELAVIIQHEARAAAWSEFVEIIRRASGL